MEAVIGPFDCRRGGVDISQQLVNLCKDAHLGGVQSSISIQPGVALVHQLDFLHYSAPGVSLFDDGLLLEGAIAKDCRIDIMGRAHMAETSVQVPQVHVELAKPHLHSYV